MQRISRTGLLSWTAQTRCPVLGFDVDAAETELAEVGEGGGAWEAGRVRELPEGEVEAVASCWRQGFATGFLAETRGVDLRQDMVLALVVTNSDVTMRVDMHARSGIGPVRPFPHFGLYLISTHPCLSLYISLHRRSLIFNYIWFLSWSWTLHCVFYD